MILAVIPGVSPIFPITSILPVIFIFSSTWAREAFDDIRRYMNDLQSNNEKVWILKNRKWEKIIRGKIKVGSVVKLEKDTECPVDFLILSTFEKSNTCYINTANLDGFVFHIFLFNLSSTYP